MHRTYDILQLFDRHLATRQLRFQAVVIGSAALNLLGVVSRLTKDCDILTPEIPKEIGEASRDLRSKFGRAAVHYRTTG
jgi:hypothetical protein